MLLYLQKYNIHFIPSQNMFFSKGNMLAIILKLMAQDHTTSYIVAPSSGCNSTLKSPVKCSVGTSVFDHDTEENRNGLLNLQNLNKKYCRTCIGQGEI
jgi:hypothetical protein